MDNNSLCDFIKELRSFFEDHQGKPTEENKQDYLDLGEISECTLEQLQELKTALPGGNPVYLAFSEIIKAMARNEVFHARLGINEIFKYYLLQTENTSSGEDSQVFLDYLYLTALFFTQDKFPFERYFYEYFIKCYHPVCSFLLSRQRTDEIERFMEHIAAVGKIAAQKQMDTSSIHHLLRNIENFAQGKELKDLHSKAKDSRYTLET